MKRPAWALIVIFWLCAACRTEAGTAWQAHGLAGVGIDGNPRERIEGRYRQSDAYQRLEAACGAQGDAWRGRWSGQLRWGTDRYARERGETRHLLRGALGWRWEGPAGWRLALEAIRAERIYPHADARDARSHEVGLQGQAPAGRRATLTLLARAGWLHSQASERCGGWDQGRRRGLQGALELQQPFTRAWRWLARAEAARVSYERPALETGPSGATLALAERQRDRSLFAACGLARLGVPLVRGTIGWRRALSNSQGAGFRRLRLDGLVAWPLDRSTRLILIARWEPGESRDEEERLVDCQIDLDDPDPGMAEFGARDRVTMRCVRTLGADLSAEFQVEWESSESRLPWERYEKTSCLLALRFQPGP